MMNRTLLPEEFMDHTSREIQELSNKHEILESSFIDVSCKVQKLSALVIDVVKPHFEADQINNAQKLSQLEKGLKRATTEIEVLQKSRDDIKQLTDKISRLEEQLLILSKESGAEVALSIQAQRFSDQLEKHSEIMKMHTSQRINEFHHILVNSILPNAILSEVHKCSKDRSDTSVINDLSTRFADQIRALTDRFAGLQDMFSSQCAKDRSESSIINELSARVADQHSSTSKAIHVLTERFTSLQDSFASQCAKDRCESSIVNELSTKFADQHSSTSKAIHVLTERFTSLQDSFASQCAKDRSESSIVNELSTRVADQNISTSKAIHVLTERFTNLHDSFASQNFQMREERVREIETEVTSCMRYISQLKDNLHEQGEEIKLLRESYLGLTKDLTEASVACNHRNQQLQKMLSSKVAEANVLHTLIDSHINSFPIRADECISDNAKKHVASHFKSYVQEREEDRLNTSTSSIEINYRKALAKRRSKGEVWASLKGIEKA